MSGRAVISCVVVMLATFLVSCAKHPVLTREESLALRRHQLEMTQRIYHQKTQDDVLVAVDKLFRLDDGDYEMFHNEHGMIAKRKWLVYAVLFAAFGQDTWYVATEPDDENGTKVEVRVVSQSQGVSPMATTTNGWTATTLPAIEDSLMSEPLYKLFYSRLDYLLGVSGEWYDCKTAKSVFAVTMKEHIEPLCLCADDKKPEELLDE